VAAFVVVVGVVALVVADVDGVVVVVDDDVVADVFVVAEDDEGDVAVVAPLNPGSSLATITPTRAMDAAAAMTADCVIRRRRTRARSRDWGEYGSTFSFMWSSLEWDVVMQASASTAHPVAGLASPVIPFSQTAISPRTPRGHSPG
jgi:bifunctional pyridoxal-dependent enzyme with beta-cystathionase and maltose regulon repressor activities